MKYRNRILLQSMKVAYIGKTLLSDVDFSYLMYAQHKVEIDCFFEINPRYCKGAAINIDRIYRKSGVFKAVDVYPEFQKFDRIVDVDRIFVVNTSGKFWFIKAFWINLCFLFFLIRNKYDVIHLVWPPNIYEFCLYAIRKRMILTVHDPFPHSSADTWIVRIRRWFAFHCIKRQVLLNKIQRKQFITTYGEKGKIIIESNLSTYDYLKKIIPIFVKDLPDKYVLFLGRISPYKGIEYLLEAMKIVHKSYPDLHLVIAGSGNFYFDINKYATLGYIKIINRFIRDEEIISLIKQSKYIVCPYTDATQSGVVMTAFAFGKPVIATNVGALPEVVVHNKYGFIVKAKDVQSLAEGMLEITPSLIDKFSVNINRDYSMGEKSWNVIADKLVKEYVF